MDGNLYGTTIGGGPDGWGVIFKSTLDGELTVLYDMCTNGCETSGYSPIGGLLQASNGSFYGTAYQGGGYFCCGGVFTINNAGTLTLLNSFGAVGPAYPQTAWIEGTDGNLYGTTAGGDYDGGTFVRMTLQGALTVLYNFPALNGSSPSQPIEAADGNFCGAGSSGGTSPACGIYGCGTLFKITPDGTETTLLSFDSTNGANPGGALAQGADGSFYGTTSAGGISSGGPSNGTIFRATAGGVLTTLHNFDQADGAGPTGGLIFATDGYLYGTTHQGGRNNAGTIFRITPSGGFTKLWDFSSSGPSQPECGLIQATDGNFYGSTSSGGESNNGTLYRFSIGLPPFVKLLPSSQRVGATVRILGSNLSGATGVEFNGTAAAFTVVSPVLIEATAPTGATSGTVEVALPSATIRSRLPFRVR